MTNNLLGETESCQKTQKTPNNALLANLDMYGGTKGGGGQVDAQGESTWHCVLIQGMMLETMV